MSTSAGMFLEQHTTKLSFVISLLDNHSQSSPIGRVEVSLNSGERALKNASSYYLFLNLPKGEYSVQVRSDNYFDEESEPINTATHNPKDPIEIKLMPRPSYPFAASETLIRGLLLDENGNQIPSGKLSFKAANKDFSSRTTETGEFVIYFGTLVEEDVVEKGGRYFVKGDTDTKINIGIEYEGISKLMELDEVEFGKTRFILIK